jgi:hypothetical protein
VNIAAMPHRQRRLVLVFVVTSLVITFFAPSVQAYDDDTHFWLTYYLARKVGYTPVQALQIASADVSVDYDHETWPVIPMTMHLEDQRKRFHALPSSKETDRCREKARRELGFPEKSVFARAGLSKSEWTLEQRRQIEAGVYRCIKPAMDQEEADRWEEAVTSGNPGVFLHYYQDRFAHRGFESQFGHLRAARIPDYLSSDTAKAKAMAQATIQELRKFMAAYWKDKPLPAAPNWKLIELVLNDFITANPSKVLLSDIYEVFDWDSDNVSICKVYGGDDCEDGRTKPTDMFRLLRKFDDQLPPNSFRAYRIVEREFPGEVSAIWMYELEKNGLPGKKTVARAFWYGSEKLKPVPNSKSETRAWRLSE